MKSRRFTWIGGGQLTSTMLPALLRAGYRCEGWWMRAPLRGVALGVPLHAEALTSFDSRDAEMVFCAVSDDELSRLASSITLPEGVSCIHFGGTHPPEVLSAVGKRRPLGVCYPLQSFAVPLSEEELRSVPFLVEAQDVSLRTQLISLVKSFGATPYTYSTEERRHLHLAAVVVNNWTTHLFAQADGYLKKLGLPFELLYPLINQTLRQARGDPQKTQSGPSSRGDRDLIDAHMEMLRDDPQLLKLYHLFDQSIQHTRSAHRKQRPRPKKDRYA